MYLSLTSSTHGHSFVTVFTSRHLGPNIWVLANGSKMICQPLGLIRDKVYHLDFRLVPFLSVAHFIDCLLLLVAHLCWLLMSIWVKPLQIDMGCSFV